MQLQTHIRERFHQLERAASRTQAATRRITRWHRRAPDVHELLLMPPDLRPADPSFAAELAAGQMGLAGAVADFGAGSPFDVRAPSEAWARELAGFGWLRHLDAVRDGAGPILAGRLFAEWLDRGGAAHPIAAAPDVLARRLAAWLAHAGLLMDGVDVRSQRKFLAALRAATTRLARIWDRAEPGTPRVVALATLIAAYLAFPDGDAERIRFEAELVRALDATVLPDGGLVCRNPAALLDLLLDLIPLRQCYLVRGLAPPPRLTAAVSAMSAMLRHLRLGCGALARFNGTGVTDRAGLATVLAIDEGRQRAWTQARESGFVRLAAGPAVLMLDAGAAPPVPVSRRAAAGCLSFELSIGRQPLIVNCGAPDLGHGQWLAMARATTRHSTLSLAEASSAELRGAGADGREGTGVMAGPSRVLCETASDASASIVAASHDGYLRRFGLLHRRTLRLDAAGTRLEGRDTLGPEHGTLRLAHDVPFAVHFHLYPDCAPTPSADGIGIDIELPNGARWCFTAEGGVLSIEESVFLATETGPRASRQIVIRGACFGESELQWSLAAVAGADVADADAMRAQELEPPGGKPTP